MARGVSPAPPTAGTPMGPLKMDKMKTIVCICFILCMMPLSGQDTFSFGTKGNYETAAHTFKLRNGSEKTMRITSIRSSCSCAVGDVDFREIPPGGIASVTCRIDLKSQEGETNKNFWVQLAWEDAKEKTAVLRSTGLWGPNASSIDVLFPRLLLQSTL